MLTHTEGFNRILQQPIQKNISSKKPYGRFSTENFCLCMCVDYDPLSTASSLGPARCMSIMGGWGWKDLVSLVAIQKISPIVTPWALKI